MGVNVVKLGDVATISAGQSAPKSNYFCEKGIPFVRAGSLEFLERGESIDLCEKISEDNAQICKLKLYPKNSILFAKSGMSANKGRIYKLERSAYIVSHLAIITPDETKLIPEYLMYWLQKHPPKTLIKDESYPSIGLTDIANMEMELPSLEEQKKIAKILDKADEIRAKKRLANEKLDEFLKSTFISMFGDKNYEKVTIGSVTDNTVQTNPSKIYEDMFYYVDIASINNEKCSIVEPKYLNVSDAPSRARKRINKDDVLVSTVRPYLRGFAIVPESLDNQIASTGFSVLRAKQEVLNPLYLFSYIKSEDFISQLLPKMEGASYPAVRDEDVRNVVFKLPPIEAQNRYSQIVEKAEAQKQKNEEVIEQMDNLFNSLSQRAFKGEL